jgi:hypothetical protein
MPLGGVVAGVVALGLAAGSAIAVAPAKAPKRQDVKAARTVIRALTRFDETALHREGAMAAAARAMVAQVQAGCAGGIPASLATSGTKKQQSVAFDVLFEGAFDLSINVDRPIEGPTVNLTKRLDHARFARRALTRGIHHVATLERGLVEIKPSDLCVDVKAAAANGFTADPPGTTRFLNSFGRLFGAALGPAPNVLKKLKTFLVTPHDKAALKRLQKLDARANTFSGKLGARWAAKLAAVLSPKPSGGGTGGFPTNPPPPAGAARRARLASAFRLL